jgi:hypothetical protein
MSRSKGVTSQRWQGITRVKTLVVFWRAGASSASARTTTSRPRQSCRAGHQHARSRRTSRHPQRPGRAGCRLLGLTQPRPPGADGSTRTARIDTPGLLTDRSLTLAPAPRNPPVHLPASPLRAPSIRADRRRRTPRRAGPAVAPTRDRAAARRPPDRRYRRTASRLRSDRPRSAAWGPWSPSAQPSDAIGGHVRDPGEDADVPFVGQVSSLAPGISSAVWRACATATTVSASR